MIIHVYFYFDFCHSREGQCTVRLKENLELKNNTDRHTTIKRQDHALTEAMDNDCGTEPADICRGFGTLGERLMHDWHLCFLTRGPSKLTVGDAQQVEVPIHAYVLLATHIFVRYDQ